ncbi:MAG: histidine kinase, partial [Butyrivibrio sp.]|nr:histidine kinase [Butyrivibrio sp.]
MRTGRIRKARMRMELIENLLQLLTTFVGALLSGISYRKSRRQAYFMLLCFYGCFALGALYWTLYLLLFDTTPRVFYVTEFGWVASVIFLRILQATLTGTNERSFRCRRAWLALAFGVPLLAFYCTFGDILSNLIWCGMMIWLSFCAIRGLAYAKTQMGAARNMR